jgi:hypothetical protein
VTDLDVSTVVNGYVGSRGRKAVVTALMSRFRVVHAKTRKPDGIPELFFDTDQGEPVRSEGYWSMA